MSMKAMFINNVVKNMYPRIGYLNFKQFLKKARPNKDTLPITHRILSRESAKSSRSSSPDIGFKGVPSCSLA